MSWKMIYVFSDIIFSDQQGVRLQVQTKGRLIRFLIKQTIRFKPIVSFFFVSTSLKKDGIFFRKFLLYYMHIYLLLCTCVHIMTKYRFLYIYIVQKEMIRYSLFSFLHIVSLIFTPTF